MHWIDDAIILSTRQHGENSAVARVLTHHHGVHAGVVRAVHSKTVRGIFQPGNIIRASWQARLPEQLGTFKAELTEANAAYIMCNPDKLAALVSACAIVEAALPERHPYPNFYSIFSSFLHILRDTDTWQKAYVGIELALLAESGFGLDLSQCAATGTTEELVYVSPKSGRAVSRAPGEPYKDRLLPLPAFLLGGTDANPPASEILAGLRLTGYFLENWLLEPHRRRLPAARARLFAQLRPPEEKEPQPA